MARHEEPLILLFPMRYFVAQFLFYITFVLLRYDPRAVARRYASTWLPLDLMSAIPFAHIDLIFESGSSGAALKMVKSLRLLRILKLVRLFKLESMASSMDRGIIDILEDFVASPRTRNVLILLKLVAEVFFMNHVLCCIWVAIGRRESLVDGRDYWLAHELRGPYQAQDTERGPHVRSIYIASFYFCLTTMTSVGYGDIITRNDSERLFAICLEFIGSFVFAIIISTLTAVVANYDMDARRAAEQLETVQSFIAKRKFPALLSRRIRRHFRQFYELKSAVDERKIFGDMSTALRMEVSAYIVRSGITKPHLKIKCCITRITVVLNDGAGCSYFPKTIVSVQMGDVKIFQQLNPSLWASLISILKPLRFDPGEVVCRQGEECSEMYIVHAGSLAGSTRVPGKVATRNRQVLAGDSINVLSILKVWNQCVETVMCPKHGGACEAYSVAAEEFGSLFRLDNPIGEGAGCFEFFLPLPEVLHHHPSCIFPHFFVGACFLCVCARACVSFVQTASPWPTCNESPR